jgi:hypothetical protein
MWRISGRLRLDGGGQFALHALHVIDVVLEEQVVRAGGAMMSSACAVPVRKKPGNVEGVDRFDQQAMPASFSASAAKRRFVHQHVLRVLPRHALRHDAARQFSCLTPSALA